MPFLAVAIERPMSARIDASKLSVGVASSAIVVRSVLLTAPDLQIQPPYVDLEAADLAEKAGHIAVRRKVQAMKESTAEGLASEASLALGSGHQRENVAKLLARKDLLDARDGGPFQLVEASPPRRLVDHCGLLGIALRLCPVTHYK
jgi:hypothetical protein